MGIGTLGGGDFFQVGLENSSEYESQTKKFFSCLVARGLENFKFLGALLFWEDLISILAKGD